MSLLTEQEIKKVRLAIPTQKNWYCKQYAVDFARAIEAKVIDKIKGMADSGIGGEYLSEVIGKVIRELKGKL